MPSTQRAAIPYPAAVDAPFAAADLQAMAEALDTAVVLHAADAADRDARYLSPIPGMLVTGDDGHVWVADLSGTWHTVYEPPPPWVAITAAANVFVQDGQAKKTSDGHVWLRGFLNSTGDGLDTGATLAWVPSGYEPSAGGGRFLAAAVDVAGSRTTSTTRLTVNTDGSINITDQEQYSMGWVCLDGIQYWTN